MSDLRVMSLAPCVAWLGVYLLLGFTFIYLFRLFSPCDCLPKNWQNKVLREVSELEQWIFPLDCNSGCISG